MTRTWGRAMVAAFALSIVPQAANVPQFEPVQPELFAAGGALTNALADFDGDGDIDLFVGFNGNTHRLYENTGGRFRDIAARVGVARSRAARAAAWGDFDGDGRADLLVGIAPGDGGILRLYRNNGQRFSDVTGTVGLTVDSGAVRQLAFIDYDGDGDLDLFVARRDLANLLFRNDGARFVEIGADVGIADTRKSVGAVWFDYEQDGDLDLYVANQDGDANGLYRNDNGNFADVAEEAGLAWGGRGAGVASQGSVRACVADVNNDGIADIVTANYGPNGVFLGRRDGRFEDVSVAWGVAIDGRYDSCSLADFDNDGLLDVYFNGTVSATQSWRDYLMRQGDNGFRDVTPPNVLAYDASHGAQWADVDGDGAIDLLLAGSRANMPHAVLRQVMAPANARRSMSVRVVDARGSGVPAAEVRVYAAGTRRLLAMRFTDAGSGYNAQSDAPVHIGLRDVARVDVEVTVIRHGRRNSMMMRNVDPVRYVRVPLRVGG